MSEKYKIKKPIRLIELFAGVGSQAMALRNIGANYEKYKVIEIDKYAMDSYNKIHNTSFQTSDITKVNGNDLNITETDKYDYILFYSFPCTDLSNAGKMQGMTEGSGTRSSLLWEVKRVLNELCELPQILIMENVTNVHSKANINEFNKWIGFLSEKGYSTYWKDMNAKDYGLPQNRNRCICVSILGDYDFKFPEPIELKIKAQDLLEMNENYTNVSEEMRKIIGELDE